MLNTKAPQSQSIDKRTVFVKSSVYTALPVAVTSAFEITVNNQESVARQLDLNGVRAGYSSEVEGLASSDQLHRAVPVGAREPLSSNDASQVNPNIASMEEPRNLRRLRSLIAGRGPSTANENLDRPTVEENSDHEVPNTSYDDEDRTDPDWNPRAVATPSSANSSRREGGYHGQQGLGSLSPPSIVHLVVSSPPCEGSSSTKRSYRFINRSPRSKPRVQSNQIGRAHV